MGLIPRSEYRDLFYVYFMGPFTVSSFAQYDISSDSLASTSISTVSQTSSVSTSGALSSENALYTAAGGSFCPDKDTYVDAAWVRSESISTVDLARLRLLSVKDGQSVMGAWSNRQFISERLNLGDDSSSEGSFSYQPLVQRTKTDLVIRPEFNKIPAGGLLLVLSEGPTNVTGLRIGLRLRERAQ